MSNEQTAHLLPDELEMLEREEIDVAQLLLDQAELLLRLAEARRALAEFRARVFARRKVDGCDHSTACTIWGDDGQGGTAEGFKEPLPCNCGALENFAKHQRDEAEKQRDSFHERWNSMRHLYEVTLDNLERNMRHVKETEAGGDGVYQETT